MMKSLFVEGGYRGAHHFSFECPRFHIQRQVMINKLLGRYNLSLNILLYADTNLSVQQNVAVFQIVQDYIF